MEPRTFNRPYHNIREWFKGRIKSGSGSCNWPELSKYCGCCPLSTGIYIRSIVVIIITFIIIAINGSIISRLLEIGRLFQNATISSEEESLLEQSGRDMDTLYFLYRTILVCQILNCTFKSIYLLTAMWTIYAIYKKKTILLKILVYISVPNLILDFLLSIVGTRLLNSNLRILMIICILSEAYNTLAISSEYKKMTGKSRIVFKDEGNQCDTNAENMDGYNPPYRDQRLQNMQIHCRSCTCFDEIIENPQRNNHQVDAPAELPTPGAGTQNVIRSAVQSENINETGVQISRHQQNYNNICPSDSDASNVQAVEDITMNNNTANNSNERNIAVRPNTLDIPNNNVTEVKIDLSDEPVIYDERQLNVGTSPVIADRPIQE